MFRPDENYIYDTPEPFDMSPLKSRDFVYATQDGFRVPSPNYRLPKQKPAGQLRIAFLGSSTVHIARPFHFTPPGSFKKLLQHRYPRRDIDEINARRQPCTTRPAVVQLCTAVVADQ